MVKGLFVGLAVIIVLALIPVVHFLGIPFGPFIAGYFGISVARDYPGTPGRRALVYGLWLGSVVGAVTVIVAAVVTIAGNFAYPILLWGGVVVATFYYASMSTLGAWYSELRAAEKSRPSITPGPTPGGPLR